MSEYKKQTDEVHTITLDSKITAANWRQKIATVGDKVSFFVQTHFVGNGSEIEIKVEDKKGKKVEKLKGLVFGDQFAGSIVIPEKAKEEIYFTAKLPKHGLEMKSSEMIVFPLIKVTNLKWGQKEARRGDIVKLSADIEGLRDEAEVMIIIYEYDQDGAHDFITKFPCRVKNKKIETEWEFEYHEDTDEIPSEEEKQRYGRHYNPPEYFFVIDVYRQRFGENQESDLLVFRDWIEVLLTNGPEEPIPDEPYVLYLPDGNTKEGKTDNEGRLREEKIPPGRVYVSFPAYFDLVSIEEGRYKMTKTIEYTPSYISKDNTKSSVEETPVAMDQVEIEPDINNVYEDEEDEMIEDEEEIQEYPEEDEEDVEGIFSLHILDPDISLKLREDYDLASKHCVTGIEYHLAVIYHLSIELLDEIGEPLEEAVQYQIKDRNGKILYEGTSDKQGFIHHSGIGMGYFELIIGDKSIWIASVPDLSIREQVVLQDNE